jgi:hypothetical protein
LLLQHLYTGLNKEDAHYLDVTTGGSFSHKTLAEGKEILDKIMERTSFICKCEPPRVESEVHHEEALAAESESTDIQPLDSTPKSSPDPESETPKEEDPLLWNFSIASRKIFLRTSETPRTIYVKRDHQFSSLLLNLMRRNSFKKPSGS